MSHRIRRNVLALLLAGLLATAARPIAARDFNSPRHAPPPRAAASGGLLPGAPGFLDQAWAWLRQLWAADSAVAPAPVCSNPSGCATPDEGPIIDPNGRH